MKDKGIIYVKTAESALVSRQYMYTFRIQNKIPILNINVFYLFITGVSTQLSRHIRSVHEGRKDYVCPTCSKAFTSTKTMNEHIDRTHRIPKDKICNYCGSVFNVQKDLMRHIKKQHKIVKDDMSPPPISLPPPILP